MFSGIIETTARLLSWTAGVGVTRVLVERPGTFDDLGIGDSVAVDGVCLTIESLTESAMLFALGPETLRITGWNEERVKGKRVNLERSLRLGDRIHGHLVTGHVDGLGQVVASCRTGDSLTLTVSAPASLMPFLWKKGSVAVNGVSLTINSVDEAGFQVGLIPETLKRTNLGEVANQGNSSLVNLEADNLARGLLRAAEWQGAGVRENSL